MLKTCVYFEAGHFFALCGRESGDSFPPPLLKNIKALKMKTYKKNSTSTDVSFEARIEKS